MALFEPLNQTRPKLLPIHFKHNAPGTICLQSSVSITVVSLAKSQHSSPQFQILSCYDRRVGFYHQYAKKQRKTQCIQHRHQNFENSSKECNLLSLQYHQCSYETVILTVFVETCETYLQCESWKTLIVPLQLTEK